LLVTAHKGQKKPCIGHTAPNDWKTQRGRNCGSRPARKEIRVQEKGEKKLYEVKR